MHGGQPTSRPGEVARGEQDILLPNRGAPGEVGLEERVVGEGVQVPGTTPRDPGDRGVGVVVEEPGVAAHAL